MAQHRTMRRMTAAMADLGIDDRLLAAGQFSPRGMTGGMLAGGLVGDGIGGLLGGPGDVAGMVAGSAAGRRMAGGRQHLPTYLRVGVSEQWVYGMSQPTRGTPSALLFRIPRNGLRVTVRPRLHVRVLELEQPSGARVELEGNRVPTTHSKDVITLLRRQD